jgi:hypothetical protein
MMMMMMLMVMMMMVMVMITHLDTQDSPKHTRQMLAHKNEPGSATTKMPRATCISSTSRGENEPRNCLASWFSAQNPCKFPGRDFARKTRTRRQRA